MTQGIVPESLVAVGLALFTLGYGFAVEKHFISRWSILFYCVGIFSLALSLDSSAILTIVALSTYAIVGIGLIASGKKGKWNIVKHLFGAKVYGSIALVYALYDTDHLYLTSKFLNFLESFGFPKSFECHIIVFAWLLLMPLVIVIAVIIYAKSKG